ncbi:SDR family NAD(P)-dependent oxidoreductase [Phytoactinopolyspora alkaliphila]|uniref:SDR family NAD(P)-dependent oxidoreductase n=1 Tax=Phytoactinopolyspora alkaliphila TaxID=1783498 RepID=A0A6N9YIG7_9ACTN|nr:SDR family NAD(P)-dependent oxidoreductase [Phytoactinopolyspora alkaliphila]NED94841.1 SDR family NAD(P)-dependent oxidoreductase [Phytoactinopolyspora alkaliphila]
MARVKNSVVVVTGASSGIGRATALAFADAGGTVVITARSEHALEEVAQQCRERGADVLVLPADVTDAAAVEQIARETAGRFGRIDTWVNNAGVTLFGRIEEAPVRSWHRVIETNVFGTYHGLRAVIPWMREQGSGVIVNVSSVVGKLPTPLVSSYTASKYAVRALSDCARQELLDVPGIAVCTVLPGPIDTPLFDHGANYSGWRPKPLKPVIAAERVAATIVSCAAKPQDEAFVGASSGMVLGFRRAAPGFAARAAAAQVPKDHFTAEPVGGSDGNLFQPADSTGSISGGWTRSSKKTSLDDPKTASESGSERSRLRRGMAVAALVSAAGAGLGGAIRARANR